MRPEDRKKGAYYEYAEEINEKVKTESFNEVLEYILSVGDQCRYGWQYSYMVDELGWFLEANPLLLFNMFKKEYKKVFPAKQLKEMGKRIERYGCAIKI